MPDADEPRNATWTGEPRYIDGRPNYAEQAYAALMVAHGHGVRDEEERYLGERWLRSAEVYALLAQREEMQNLARSNRELAAAMEAVAARNRQVRAA